MPCLKVLGTSHKRKRPWRPTSVVNISAMSFGALGRNAISALNLGAKMAHCFHNTGEGGLSPYHLLGGDVVFEIGTGYFGVLGKNGKFSMDVLAEKCAKYPQIRAIEIKLSQGAKPGKGGVLPAAKVVPEIADTRHVPAYQDCISPNSHASSATVDEMIDFIERIADRTGLPVGIKVRHRRDLDFWEELARRMKKRKEGPDHITIDGGEGGTGAAPLTYTDHVSLPFKIGFARVYQIFQKAGVSRDVVWIGSGKLGFPDRAVVAFAMGCDLVNVAREAMISIGCIQSQSCHTGHCPTGITTMSDWRQAGLDVDIKAVRAANYIKGFRKELLALAHTAGYEHPCQFQARDIELSTGVNKFTLAGSDPGLHGGQGAVHHHAGTGTGGDPQEVHRYGSDQEESHGRLRSMTMRRSVMLISMLFFLAPSMAVHAESGVEVHIAYLGQDQFRFKKTVYDYTDLVQAVQAEYAGERIRVVVVNMGEVASVNDRKSVCRLKQDLQAKLKMHLHVEGETRELFCN